MKLWAVWMEANYNYGMDLDSSSRRWRRKSLALPEHPREASQETQTSVFRGGKRKLSEERSGGEIPGRWFDRTGQTECERIFSKHCELPRVFQGLYLGTGLYSETMACSIQNCFLRTENNGFHCSIVDMDMVVLCACLPPPATLQSFVPAPPQVHPLLLSCQQTAVKGQILHVRETYNIMQHLPHFPPFPYLVLPPTPTFF